MYKGVTRLIVSVATVVLRERLRYDYPFGSGHNGHESCSVNCEMKTDELERNRAGIDRIDLALLRLLNDRARVAVKIGRLKKLRRMVVQDGTRESAILERICDANRGPLDRRALTRIFAAIVRESRRVQHSVVTEK
jgi:chorismate mutase